MSTTPTKKKSSLFAKIENRSEALKIIKDISITFIVLGVIEGVVGYFLFPMLLYDAVLYIVLGLILLAAKSRIAAVLLLVLSGFSVVTTFTNMLGLTANGGANIVVALLIFFGAIKAVEATFKLHGRFAHKPGRFSPDEYVIPEELKGPRPPGFSLDELMQSNKPESRFTTLEWVLIGLAGVLVLSLLVVVFVVFLG